MKNEQRITNVRFFTRYFKIVMMIVGNKEGGKNEQDGSS